jgi:hypothetical protein
MELLRITPGNGRSGWEYKYYWRYNVLYLPALENHEPLEVLLSLSKLADIMPSIKHKDVSKYFWECREFFDRYTQKYKGLEEYHYVGWHALYDSRYFTAELKMLEGIDERQGLVNLDLQLLNRKLEQNRDRLTQNIWWNRSERLVRTYLKSRVWDIARYGDKVANLTYPQPTIEGATAKQVADIVAWMVSALQEEQRRNEEQAEEQLFAYYEQKIQQDFDEKVSKEIVPMPDNLPPRVLSTSEIEALKNACRTELRLK